MKIRELIDIIDGNITEDDDEVMSNQQDIAAASILISSSAENADAPSKMSTEAFIKILSQMGMPITIEGLMDIVEAGELSDIITDVSQDEVYFAGNTIDSASNDDVFDKAEQTVNQMAKRNMRKGIHK